ncbi:SCP2 sterol-binding domain-containing protein [Micromonospora sp. NPDC049523]|uniref:SCP2 sterol-binding domain-containing protein n=1 Tax=unclassified Micromonospora TaxID=2617518 RepID=UPI002DDBBF3C|nr:SCP2 sterol-binding domain-containing protein [Micromonospora sp. NBC_01796]WSA88750.1 SCP2 sterol-binding domain-containing protein [Micromonospora sp. NBC_01796]
MSDFDPASFSSLDPKQFAKLVKTTPDAQIATVMKGDSRGPILDQIFERMPSLFRADRAGSTNTVIHWNISGRPDGGVDTYEVVIDNGTCTVTGTPVRDPKLALTLGPVEFLKVVSGGANPVMMFMTGKLKAKGDLALASNIANLFDIPKG